MQADQDRKTAFLELRRVFELALKLPDLIPTAPLNQCQSEAGSLYNDILQCLNMALSMLSPKAKDFDDRTFSYNSNTEVEEEEAVTLRRSRPRRDNGVITSKGLTNAPFEDGYLWRKYGQKEIKKSKFRKSYYRCANSGSQKCPAKKQVQRYSNDPSLYQVTYCEQHTCSSQSNFSPLDLVLDFPTTNNSFQLIYANAANHQRQSAFSSNHNNEAPVGNPNSRDDEITQALVSVISQSPNCEEVNAGNLQQNGSGTFDNLSAIVSIHTESAADTYSWIEEFFVGNSCVEDSTVFDPFASELDYLSYL